MKMIELLHKVNSAIAPKWKPGKYNSIKVKRFPHQMIKNSAKKREREKSGTPNSNIAT